MDEYTSGAYPLVLHADADPSRLGGTAICGFSTVGSVGVIAASHLIQTLELSPMGTVMHPKFPAICADSRRSAQAPGQGVPRRRYGRFHRRDTVPQREDVYFGETVMEWFTKGASTGSS
ncbi:MAG: hypothetical protein CM1200mP32_11470 [Methanobacteriota archaeon]|nr:MAG: hypothetical protein CM1200mP32_11470 [Euryarchaeota archaeon]